MIKRNANYWGDAPKFEDVTIRFPDNCASRVREARSRAINREAIINRIQFSSGALENQFPPEGIFAHTPRIPQPGYVRTRARELPAEITSGLVCAPIPKARRRRVQRDDV